MKPAIDSINKQCGFQIQKLPHVCEMNEIGKAIK